MVLKKIQYDVQLLSTETALQAKVPAVYTNDLNSAEFVFNIDDMTPEQLAGATATTLLYMRDGSFFQNSDVNLNGNTFTYLLKENEGNHAGLAKIQLVVKIGTIEYASQLYSFEVVSGLETKVAVPEVMINDWTTLTREAQAYIAQFLLDEEGRQATFVANEQDRQLAFEGAEELRQQKETERQEAESGRIEAEQSRVDAEGTRQTTFTTNEATRHQRFDDAQTERTSVFTQSETDRATAFGESEALRQAGYDADHGRAETDHATAMADHATAVADHATAVADHATAMADHTTAMADHTTAMADHTTAAADHAMVQGFNARLTAEETATANNKISAVKGKTFPDVDARFEEVEADTTMMGTNLVKNGDFSNGTTGWNGNGSTISVQNNILTNTSNGQAVSPNAATAIGNKIIPQANEVYYIKSKVRATSASCTKLDVYLFGNGAAKKVMDMPHPVENTWYTLRGIIKIDPIHSGIELTLYNTHVYPDAATGNGKAIEVQYVSIINLTATFGAGNEPTVEQMDAIMAKFPNSWFDGTRNLFLAKWALAELLRLGNNKANKVQEAWITPTLINGWVNFDSASYPSCAYMKDEMGFVHLKGMVKGGTIGSNVFVLPSGCRPLKTTYFTVDSSNAWGQCIVSANGLVSAHMGGATWFGLDNITFRAEA